jgi:hypothetical protein
MDTELTPEQRFNAENAERMVPRALQEGRSRESIMAELLRLDWSPSAAKALIERVARDLERYQGSPNERAELLRDCRKQMCLGLVLGILGLVATGMSALLALGGAQVVIVFTGLLLVGFGMAFRGFSRWRLYQREQLPWRER